MLREHLLYSEKQSDEWKNGMPIGNGRIAGMICGGLDGRIALNHELLCRGENTQRKPDEVPAEKLDEVRKLLLDGDYHAGTLLGNQLFAGKGGISGEPVRVDPYLPAGDVVIDFGDDSPNAYYRALELDHALFRSEYTCGRKRVSRRSFAAFGGGCICYEYVSSELSALRVSYKAPQIDGCVIKSHPEAGGISVYGEFEGDSHFAVKISLAECDGESSFDGSTLVIEKASRAVIYINLGAGSKACDVKAEANALPEESFDELLEKHISAYREKYAASGIALEAERSDMPLEKRLERMRNGETDAGIALLWYNYAKYLLLSSCGKLPPNLQGKWNDNPTPPWECDYHLDINLQMCYWFAEAAGLGCCTQALFELCENMAPNGREAAKLLYGCNGILFPLTTDSHACATPEAYGWAVWTGAAAWLGMHFWEHWEYSRDKKFLAEHAYPFLKGVAEFYADYLVEVDGVMQLVPSQSPENNFGGEKMPVSLCVSSAMDVQLCEITLAHAADASRLLGCDLDERLYWEELRRKLPGLGVGSRGQLLEWNSEFTENEPGHRHYSHLIGVYPGEVINERDTPELFRAAEVSLRERLSHGGGHTGWSRSWTACLLARFNDSEGAWEHLNVLIKDFATDSLLDLHPPRIFQIDGNFGGAAAVSEMLLCSRRDAFKLLPALPEAWKSGGEVREMRVKGGFKVSFAWRDGKVTELEICAESSHECHFSGIDETLLRVHPDNGAGFDIAPLDGIFGFSAVKGEVYRIKV